jgi:DNA-directed RNA polymerase specialized sigma subunit
MQQPLRLFGLRNEYQATRIALLAARIKAQKDSRTKDVRLIDSMARDVQWVIAYMDTGYPPALGKSDYQTVVPVDPKRLNINRSIFVGISIHDTQVMVAEVIGELPDREREALLMVVCQGLSYSDAADLLGVKKSSVQSYVKRAIYKVESNLAIRVPLYSERVFSE